MSGPKLARVIDIHALKSACSNCSLREMCLPTGLSADEIEKLDQMVYTRKRVKRGDSVYRSEEKFGSLYADQTEKDWAELKRSRKGKKA